MPYDSVPTRLGEREQRAEVCSITVDGESITCKAANIYESKW